MTDRLQEMEELKLNRKKRAGYKSHALFDYLIDHCGFKNDADIAVRLKATAPSVSRIRHQNFKVGPTMILATYDATGLSIEKIRELCK